MKSLLRTAAAATEVLISVACPTCSCEAAGNAEETIAVAGDTGPLAVRSPVHRDERIRTSQNGLGEFLFRDGTKFAVGGNSSVVVVSGSLWVSERMPLAAVCSPLLRT